MQFSNLAMVYVDLLILLVEQMQGKMSTPEVRKWSTVDLLQHIIHAYF